MNLIRHIPNFFTSLNLLSGCVGIVFVTTDRVALAPFFILASGFFDFLDGFTARLLKVNSDIGKEFDSLADMVTFGVLPSFVLFHFLSNYEIAWLPYLGFSVAIFSGLRLAKFNIDATQRKIFVGFPTPANALFITGLVYLQDSATGEFFLSLPTLISIVLISSFLMICPWKFIAMKFDTIGWHGNQFKYVLLIGSLLLLLLGGLQMTSFVILWYILVSLVGNISGSI